MVGINGGLDAAEEGYIWFDDEEGDMVRVCIGPAKEV